MLTSNLSSAAVNPPPPQALTGSIPASLTEDGFLNGRLRILQPERGYRAGIDAVFVAAAIPCAAGESVFEAGLGTGVAALCLLARMPSIHITGMEVGTRYALLAEENARRNGLGQHLRVIHGDVKEALRRDLSHLPAHGSFSHAFANPPYFEQDKITASVDALKAQAHAFGPQDLDLWVKVLHTMTAPRGTVTFIHRADMLGKLLGSMESRFGNIRVAPLYARAGTAASRVLVQGVKGSRAPMQILPGFILHGSDNRFTLEAEAILRNGMAWPLK